MDSGHSHRKWLPPSKLSKHVPIGVSPKSCLSSIYVRIYRKYSALRGLDVTAKSYRFIDITVPVTQIRRLCITNVKSKTLNGTVESSNLNPLHTENCTYNPRARAYPTKPSFVSTCGELKPEMMTLREKEYIGIRLRLQFRELLTFNGSPKPPTLSSCEPG